MANKDNNQPGRRSIRENMEEKKRDGLTFPLSPFLKKKESIVTPNRDDSIPPAAPTHKGKNDEVPSPKPKALQKKVSNRVLSGDSSDFIKLILSTEKRYENSKKSVIIDEKYKNKLDTLSKLSGTDVSQILNNFLGSFFNPDGDNYIMNELHEYMVIRASDITKTFKPE